MMYSIDTETTGLQPYLGDYAFMATWQENTKPSAACIFSLHDTSDLVRLVQSDLAAVGHNIAFDLAFLQPLGLIPRGEIHDTMIAAHVFNAAEPSKELKALAKKYLKRENVEEQRLIAWFKENGMLAVGKREYIKVPEDIIVPYAKADVEMTLELFKFYQQQGVIDDPIYKLEMQVLPIVMRIVRTGMRVNKAYAKEQAIRATTRALELTQLAREAYKIESLGSDQELSNVLFKEAGLECKLFTPSGAPCLDEVALQEYAHPVIPLVSEYRELTKLTSTYLAPMLEATDDVDRIHGSIKQVGARTGRMSSNSPNLQNLPRSGGAIDIRRAFIPAPEYALFLVDLSQIELRVLAHYCKEPIMLEALQTREGDLHAATSQMLFGLVDKKHRTIAKTINFATIYGAGAAKLTEQLNKALPEAQFTVQQVKEFKWKYYAGYPKLQEFIWLVEGLVRQRGFVKDVFGRRYPCEPDAAYRGVNYVIQGCSAGIFKTALVKISKFLQDNSFKTRLINLVHDEFIFELHESEHHIMPELQRIIEDFQQFRVPIYANASIAEDNWSAKRDLHLLK